MSDRSVTKLNKLPANVTIAQEEEKNNDRNITKFSPKKVEETDITYEELKEKPDMRISLLKSSEIKEKTRTEVIKIAKESVRKKNHPRNTEEMRKMHTFC